MGNRRNWTTSGVDPTAIVVELTESMLATEGVKATFDRFHEEGFRLALDDTSLTVQTKLAGFPVGELEARLDVVGGWFVLKPKRAKVLGVPAYAASLFRTFLPLPPLPEDARLMAIDHEPGLLRLTFEADDFEERVTPGLVDRLRKRVLPIG